MLKAILIDDEYWIVRGLSEAINWAELGIELVFSADNAQKALEFCKAEAPDIVITDINMPEISGLELTEKLSSLCPDALVVVISGHDEFEYAQKAISLNIFEYVLKPIDLEAFIEVLRRAAKKVYGMKQTKHDAKNVEDAIEENQTLLTRWLIKCLIERATSRKNVAPRHEKLLEPFQGMHSVACKVQMDDFLPGVNEMKFYDGLVAAFNEREVLHMNSGGCVTICFFDQSEQALVEKLPGYAEVIQGVASRDGHSVTIAFGKVMPSVYELSDSYEAASIAATNRFVSGKNNVFYYEEPGPEDSEPAPVAPADYSELYNSVMVCNISKISQMLLRIKGAIKDYVGDRRPYVQAVVSNVLTGLQNALKDTSLKYAPTIDTVALSRQITEHQTLDEVMLAFRRVLIGIAKEIGGENESDKETVIKRAKVYLTEHFCDHDIRLEDVAKAAAMSPSYFCIVFKQETGKSFVDYLTSMRMEKAKRLLSGTNYKSFEISSMVGYPNHTYFCTVFKKYMSVSPNTYRTMHSGSAADDKRRRSKATQA